MTLTQLLAFTWVLSWVLAETLFPKLTHQEKIQGALLATFAIGYLNDVHGVVWRKLRSH